MRVWLLPPADVSLPPPPPAKFLAPVDERELLGAKCDDEERESMAELDIPGWFQIERFRRGGGEDGGDSVLGRRPGLLPLLGMIGSNARASRMGEVARGGPWDSDARSGSDDDADSRLKNELRGFKVERRLLWCEAATEGARGGEWIGDASVSM